MRAACAQLRGLGEAGLAAAAAAALHLAWLLLCGVWLWMLCCGMWASEHRLNLSLTGAGQEAESARNTHTHTRTHVQARHCVQHPCMRTPSQAQSLRSHKRIHAGTYLYHTHASACAGTHLACMHACMHGCVYVCMCTHPSQTSLRRFIFRLTLQHTHHLIRPPLLHSRAQLPVSTTPLISTPQLSIPIV